MILKIWNHQNRKYKIEVVSTEQGSKKILMIEKVNRWTNGFTGTGIWLKIEEEFGVDIQNSKFIESAKNMLGLKLTM